MNSLKRYTFKCNLLIQEERCNTSPCVEGQDPDDMMAAFNDKVRSYLETSTNGIVKMWQTWESWGACGTKCGRAYRERKRQCPTGFSCMGSNVQRATCTAIWGCKNAARAASIQSVQSQFTPWSTWTPCSASCEIGMNLKIVYITLA